MSKSIIQTVKQCWVCESLPVEKHHCIHGIGKRAKAEKNGLWVWLCPEHHRGTFGVHGREGHELDLILEQTAQQAFEKNHSRDEWMELFGRNYLDE